jgi:hypothetical protein
MRKVAAALFFIAALGMLAPPVFAQAPAPAPAPKVTINGLVDFVVTAYHNWSGGNLVTADVTNPRDTGWYSRERGVFTITGEVGRTKGVWAVELDFTNGAGVVGNSGNSFNGGLNGQAMSGTSANFDMDIDVASVVETKWLYIETPATGEGSFLPWIPFQSTVMAGGQPWRGIDYKFGTLLSGDGPGVTLRTNWTPDIRSTLAYVQVGARLDPTQAPDAKNNWAVATALEVDIFKGFTIKPTFAYASYLGGNCGTNNLGTYAYGGYQPNQCNTSTAVPPVLGPSPPPLAGSPLGTTRYTIGGDLRWVFGGFTLQPGVYYQWGNGQSYVGPLNPLTGLPLAGNTQGKRDNTISAFLFDTIVGYRIGPLNMQGRVMFTPGQKAQQMVNNGAQISLYNPINSGFGYMAGWTDIQTGGIDYITSAFVGSTEALVLRSSPSYDKYGRIFAGGAVDYALTPALTFTGLGNISWTANSVNTQSILSTIGLIPCPAAYNRAQFGTCIGRGDGGSNFLGIESALGMTYRFAPNVALDLIGSYMFTGNAMSNAGVNGQQIGGTCANPNDCAARAREPDDIWKVSTRLRFTF